MSNKTDEIYTSKISIDLDVDDVLDQTILVTLCNYVVPV